MAWITNSNISTANLDADTDSPLSARPDIKAALDELIVAGNARGAANGVASLDGDTLVPNTQLPNTLISSGSNNLTLDPGSGKVAIQDILNLNPKTVAQLNALTSAEGDVAYVSNDTGGKALAVYDGSNWKKLTLGATIST
tara:strand:- start:1098 stop:1520 length:423 start_codon:yes stop_codon:yes gene_type:complete